MEKIETKHRRTCDIQSNHSDALITFSLVNKVYVLNFLSFHEHLHVSQDHVSPSPMLVQFFFYYKAGRTITFAEIDAFAMLYAFCVVYFC